jgi:hypothetical protein
MRQPQHRGAKRASYFGCVHLCVRMCTPGPPLCMHARMCPHPIQAPSQVKLQTRHASSRTSTQGAGSSSPRRARTATSNRVAPNSFMTFPVFVSIKKPSSLISRPRSASGSSCSRLLKRSFPNPLDESSSIPLSAAAATRVQRPQRCRGATGARQLMPAVALVLKLLLVRSLMHFLPNSAISCVVDVL